MCALGSLGAGAAAVCVHLGAWVAAVCALKLGCWCHCRILLPCALGSLGAGAAAAVSALELGWWCCWRALQSAATLCCQ